MRIGEAYRHNDTKRKTLTYEDTQNIGILFYVESEDALNELGQFIHTLKREKKKVTVLAFIPETNPKTLDFNHFSIMNKDFSLIGQMNSYNAHEFIHNPFDYLYCISLKPLLEFEYVLAASKSLCRIGPMLPGFKPYLEMMFGIQPGQNETDLIKAFIHYTKTLKNNKQLAAAEVS